MSLLISIIEFPENCTVAESTKTFGEQGGTIGRAAENYWVLSDPDCFLSSSHSEVTFENGHYILTDTSTNGTFLNGSREPMGKGNKVQLQDGDEIELSDYKFRVELLHAANANDNSSSMDNFAVDQNDPFSSPLQNNDITPQSDFMSSDPFASGEISPIEPLLNSSPEVVDPLAVLDNKQANHSASFAADVATPDSNYFSSSHSDQAEVLGQSVIWPQSHIDESLIPEDWESNGEENIGLLETEKVDAANNTMVDANTIQALRAENAALQKELLNLKALKNKNISLQTELKNIKQQFLLQQKSGSAVTHSNVDTTMISAMGLPVNKLSVQQISAINKVAGKMVRETVKGMMLVLTSRSSIKNEFRMNVTTIQPIENNPLKFSANIDDALENMFLKSGSSYKKPMEAITDGFQGIAEHQIAILAGIRAAFKGAVERFEPRKLEYRFDKQNQNYFKSVPFLKKAQNWNQFVHYFDDLTDDMDNSFQYLFGDAFVQAYEDQLHKLLVARKSQKVV